VSASLRAAGEAPFVLGRLVPAAGSRVTYRGRLQL
jgi:hypothetical protein